MQFDDLPYEILFHIFTLLSPSTALSVGTTNKTLYFISQDDQLWKTFCFFHFPVEKCNYEIPQEWLWKNCYQHFNSMHLYYFHFYYWSRFLLFISGYGVKWRPLIRGVSLHDNGYIVECKESTDFPRFKVFTIYIILK